MNAIIDNGQIWIITEERGSFFYTERLGKTKCFNKNEVQVVDAEPEKAKYSKKKIILDPKKGEQSKVRFLSSLIAANLEENMNARSIYYVISANVNDIPEIIESIISQANRKNGVLSEKQIYVLAKFMYDNHFTL